MSDTLKMVSMKLHREKSFRTEEINSPDRCIQFIREKFGDYAQECIIILYLDTKGHPVCFTQMGKGTVDHCVCSSRDIFAAALLSGARSVIMMHNHPSGDVKPSEDDIKMTKKVIAGGLLMDISVLDHIVFSDRDYYSMMEHESVDFKPDLSLMECLKVAEG